MTSDKQQQLIRELVIESTEALDQFEQDLLSLEKNATDSETLNRIFRAIHSLKGTSGCLALHKIERLAHTGENVLSLMRDGKLRADKELVSKLFAFSDGLRRTLGEVAQTGSEGAADHVSLIADLEALHRAAAEVPAEQESKQELEFKAGACGLFSDEEPAQAAAPAAESPAIAE